MILETDAGLWISFFVEILLTGLALSSPFLDIQSFSEFNSLSQTSSFNNCSLVNYVQPIYQPPCFIFLFYFLFWLFVYPMILFYNLSLVHLPLCADGISPVLFINQSLKICLIDLVMTVNESELKLPGFILLKLGLNLGLNYLLSFTFSMPGWNIAGLSFASRIWVRSK